MTDIKTGLWQNTLDGSYIKVRRSGKIGVYYNDEGCDIEHVMSRKEFNHCYILVNADKPAPMVDDTFNDDTPAQTLSNIRWDEGTDEKCESILVTVCSKCGTTVPADNVEDSALSRWAARFLKAVKGIEVGE